MIDRIRFLNGCCYFSFYLSCCGDPFSSSPALEGSAGATSSAGTSSGGTSSGGTSSGGTSSGGTSSAGASSGGASSGGASSAGASGVMAVCSDWPEYVPGKTLGVSYGTPVSYRGKRYLAQTAISYASLDCAPDAPAEWCANWFTYLDECL